MQAGSALSSRTVSAICSKVASSGSSRLIEFTPISAQSACLPATYFTDPGSEPTRMVPKPGSIPRAFSVSTLVARSFLISADTALPSILTAMMGHTSRSRVRRIGVYK